MSAAAATPGHVRPSPIGRELCHAYLRFLRFALPQRTQDAAVVALLLRHEPSCDQAAHAWTVAGDFYGGWITSNIKGPFKGAPGSRAW